MKKISSIFIGPLLALILVVTALPSGKTLLDTVEVQGASYNLYVFKMTDPVNQWVLTVVKGPWNVLSPEVVAMDAIQDTPDFNLKDPGLVISNVVKNVNQKLGAYFNPTQETWVYKIENGLQLLRFDLRLGYPQIK